MLNSSQIKSISRHLVTYAMGAASALAALHVVSAGDATTISDSITKISGGVAGIVAGLAPLVAIGSATLAAWSSSHASQIAAVNDAIPGVKVVSAVSTSPTVTEPPKSV